MKLLKRLTALILMLVLLLTAGAAMPEGLEDVQILPVITAPPVLNVRRQIVGGWLRMRIAPSYDALQIASYPAGTIVTVLNDLGEWCYVKTDDGNAGYMASAYLSSTVTPEGSTTATVVSSNGYDVKLRMGPGMGYDVLMMVKVGTNVTVLQSGTDWSYIRVNGVNGYMMSQFLSGSGVVPTPVPGSGYIAYVTSANGRGVYLRSGAGFAYPSLGLYDVGTVVTVLQHGVTWDYIQIGTTRGYMKNEFLTTSGVVTTVTAVSLNTTAPGVGTVLSAQITPANATVTYVWTDQNGLALGTGATYTVKASDIGRRIRVTVTGNGRYTGAATSALSSAVTSQYQLTGVMLNVIQPYIGQTIRATVAPVGAMYTISWYRNNGDYIGTGDSYTVTFADVGYGIYATAIGMGGYSGTVVSGTTSPVLPIAPVTSSDLY